MIDPTTVATSGIIRPQNGCVIARGRLVKVAAPAELARLSSGGGVLRTYGVGRMFFNRVNAHLIISGAFGLFSRRVLVDLGGYQTHAVGEDMELVVRMHRYLRQQGTPYRITFSPDALSLSQRTLILFAIFGKQRTRWHQGPVEHPSPPSIHVRPPGLWGCPGPVRVSLLRGRALLSRSSSCWAG